MEELRLDGNAAAGTLQQIFAFEVTTAIGTCAHCSAVGPVGRASVYATAIGTVLRCTVCEGVLLRVANDGSDRYWVEMTGLRCLEFRAVSAESR